MFQNSLLPTLLEFILFSYPLICPTVMMLVVNYINELLQRIQNVLSLSLFHLGTCSTSTLFKSSFNYKNWLVTSTFHVKITQSSSQRPLHLPQAVNFLALDLVTYEILSSTISWLKYSNDVRLDHFQTGQSFGHSEAWRIVFFPLRAIENETPFIQHFSNLSQPLPKIEIIFQHSKFRLNFLIMNS